MQIYSILVTNNAPGCDTQIEQQLTVTGCETYIVRLASNSNALGPFNVYVDDVIYYSNVSRNDMLDGVTIQLMCPTPTTTPTPTPTPTVTSTVTPTIGASPTPTPTVTTTMTPTPSTFSHLRAYIVPEPQDFDSQNDLGQWLYDNGAINFFGYTNNGFAAPGTTNYVNDMGVYIQYSGWSGSSNNFVTNISTLSNTIRQSFGSGVDSFGCVQNQYCFGTIEVSTSQVIPSIQYNYTIWIPLNGVGGSMTNMILNIGDSSACTSNLFNNAIPDTTLAGINVTVPSGAAIPSGTYRVLWNFVLPASTPLGSNLYFKGDNKI